MVATSEISTQVVLIKAKMGSEFRRFRMAAYNADMDRLTTILRHHFEIDPVDELKICYEDSDGDFIRMSTDYDFVEACHHALPKEQGEWEMIVTVETCPDDFQQTAKMISLMLGLVKECETNPSRSNCQALRSIARTLEATAQRIGKIPTGNVEFGDFQMAESVPPESSNYETVHGVPFNVFREIERGEEEEDLLQVLGQTHSDDSNRKHAEEGDDDESEDEDEVDLGCVDGHSLLEFHRHLRTIRRKSFDSIRPLVDDDVSDSETTGLPQTERRQSIFWGPPAISGPSLTFPARFNRSKIFTVPFPATFSFPPSPTPTETVFTLSENTPFPFSPSTTPGKKMVTTASASTCTARKITRTTGICASVRTTETCVQTEEKKSVTEASTQTRPNEAKVYMSDFADIKVPSFVIENTVSVTTDVAVCVPVVEEPEEFPIDEDEEPLEDDEDEEELETDEELEIDSTEVEQLPSGVEVPLSPISPESVTSDLDDFVVV